MIRNCEICGTEFDAHGGRTKNCSPECSREATLRAKRENNRRRGLGSSVPRATPVTHPSRAAHDASDRRPDMRFFEHSLADTHEPAELAVQRGEYLTGGATAAVFRGGVVVASGGAG